MKTSFKTGLTLGILVFVGCVYGCSSDDGNDGGTGGTDSGGAATKGGAGGKGGAAGSSGKAQSGGTAGGSSVTLGGAAGKANAQGGASGAGLGGTGSGGKATGGSTATGGASTGGSGTGGKATAGNPGTAGTAGTAGAKPTGGVAGSAGAGTAGKTGIAGSVSTAGTAGRGVAGAGTGGVSVAGATAFGGTGGTTSIFPGTAGTAGVGTKSVQSMIVGYLGQSCYECAQLNCSDPEIAGTNLFDSSCDNVTGNATAGTAVGTSKQSLCFDTLTCVLGNKCSSASSVQPCFCGTAAGTTCLSAPAGVCKDTEFAGLETNDATTAGLTFTNPNFGAGRANAMVLCMIQNCTNIDFPTSPSACNGIVQ